jgi:hypothetical protein
MMTGGKKNGRCTGPKRSEDVYSSAGAVARFCAGVVFVPALVFFFFFSLLSFWCFPFCSIGRSGAISDTKFTS